MEGLQRAVAEEDEASTQKQGWKKKMKKREREREKEALLQRLMAAGLGLCVSV